MLNLYSYPLSIDITRVSSVYYREKQGEVYGRAFTYCNTEGWKVE